MSNQTEEQSVYDRGICVKHADGKHCWHQNGQRSYQGTNEITSPVVCCHCNANAKMREYARNPEVIYD